MLSHLVLVHKDDPDIHITCEVPGCQATFTRVHSYKSHLRRSNRNVDLKAPIEVDEDEDGQPRDETDRMEVENEAIPIDEDDDIGLYDKLEDRAEANKRLNALYLLKTKETQLLTQKTLDSIVEGSTSLVRNTVELIRDEVANRLDSAGIRFDAVPGLNDLFQENHSISNPFSHILTKSKQSAFYRENFGLVVSIRVLHLHLLLLFCLHGLPVAACAYCAIMGFLCVLGSPSCMHILDKNRTVKKYILSYILARPNRNCFWFINQEITILLIRNRDVSGLVTVQNRKDLAPNTRRFWQKMSSYTFLCSKPWNRCLIRTRFCLK
jgi:hypothetical protein